MTTFPTLRWVPRAAVAASFAVVASLAYAQAPAVDRPQLAWWTSGPDPSPVRIHPDAKVTPSQRERLQRHADLGVDALRRYVWITRGIWNWRLKELLDPHDIG
jgi:hypothetical protein